MLFAFRLIAVKGVQNVDEFFAILLRRALGKDFVGTVQQEGCEVNVGFFSGIRTVMLEQEIEGHVKIIRDLFQCLLVRLANAALIAVVSSRSEEMPS